MALNKNKLKAKQTFGEADGNSVHLGEEYVARSNREIPINQIAYNENNDYRAFECEPEDIERFANNIEKQGFHGALIVTERKSLDPTQADKRFVLLGGERRLRALQLLFERNDDNKAKYASIPCTVLSGFSEDPELRQKQEMLILDGDNLNTRGGLNGYDDEAFAIRVTERYISNMKDVYGITDAEAVKYLKEVSGQATTIMRNRRLVRKLIPELFVLVIGRDSGVSRLEEDKLTSLSQEEQKAVVGPLALLAAHRETLDAQYGKEVKKLIEEVLDADKLTDAEERKNAFTQIAKAEEIKATIRALNALKEQNIINESNRQAVETSRSRKNADLVNGKREAYISYVSRAEASLTKLSKIKGLRDKLPYFEANRQQGDKSFVEELDRIIALANTLKELAKGVPEAERDNP